MRGIQPIFCLTLDGTCESSCCTLGLPWWLSWSRICLQCKRPRFSSWVGKIHWRRDKLPTPVYLGFPGGPAGKESTCSAGDLGLIPGLGRSPGEGKATHSSILAWRIPYIVCGVAKSQTCLSNFDFHVVHLKHINQIYLS